MTGAAITFHTDNRGYDFVPKFPDLLPLLPPLSWLFDSFVSTCWVKAQ